MKGNDKNNYCLKFRLIFLLVGTNIIFAQQVYSPDETFSISQDRIYYLADWEYMFITGEQEDTNWTKLNPAEFHLLDKGVYELRTSVDVKKNPNDDDLIALTFFNIPAAYEIYWNSNFIAKNGIVSSNKEVERLGKSQIILTIPYDYVKDGNNKIELRMSNNYDYVKLPHFEVLLSPHQVIQDLVNNDLYQELLQLGLYFTAFIICFILFLGGWRDLSFLFLGIYVLFQAFVSIWIYLNAQSLVTTNSYQFLEPVLIYMQLLFMLLLIAFILWHLETDKKIASLISSTIVIILINIFSGFAVVGVVYSAFYTFLFGLILSIYSLIKSKSGSLLFAIGLVPIFLFFTSQVYSIVFNEVIKLPFYADFIAVSIFVSMTIGSISAKLLAQHKRYQEILIKSQRLENELLKKTIQPHFISNTLLSLKHLIKKQPIEAEKMIELLSKEFEIINEASSKKQISIQSEVELCNYHLQLMGYRRAAKYSLETDGVESDMQIPPLVLHTLVENGLTHSYQPKEDGQFQLSCKRNKNILTIQLTNNGSRLEKLSAKDSTEVEEGLGLRYVRSRLEESYSGRWGLSCNYIDNLWEVKISISE